MQHAPEFERQLRESKFAADLRPIKGTGFAGFDFECAYGESDLRAIIQERIKARLTDFIRISGSRSWCEIRRRRGRCRRPSPGTSTPSGSLDDYTDLIQKTLQTVEPVSKIDCSGRF